MESAQAGEGSKPEAQTAAQQVNTALETLKRYIPTELLALYLPFIAITQDQYKDGATTVLQGIYAGFVLAAPLLILMLYVAKAAEAGQAWNWRTLPYFEGVLGLAAFAVWGASVPGVFIGQQWWLSLVALVSALVLPLIDTVFSPKRS